MNREPTASRRDYRGASAALLHVLKRSSDVHLTKDECRVFHAITANLSAWGKCTDRMSSSQIAVLAGIHGNEKSRAQRIRRTLRSLYSKGLLAVYVPGTSIRDLPLVGIEPHPDRDGVCDTNPICPGLRSPSETPRQPH